MVRGAVHAFEDCNGTIGFFCLIVHLDLMVYFDTETVFLNAMI